MREKNETNDCGAFSLIAHLTIGQYILFLILLKCLKIVFSLILSLYECQFRTINDTHCRHANVLILNFTEKKKKKEKYKEEK